MRSPEGPLHLSFCGTHYGDLASWQLRDRPEPSKNEGDLLLLHAVAAAL